MGIIEEEQIAEESLFNGEDDESSSEDCESSASEGCDSDDSYYDPSFSLEGETRSGLSRLSIKKKNKLIGKGKEEGSKEVLDLMDVNEPELGKEDRKCFEAVHKIIEVGKLETLKLDECKVYLRKYGLRLTGNKETLIHRIKEHLEVLNGGGEKKYPVSSFILDCKGDACMGDVVMFQQNVYEMFNLASRSANGPPCGTRTVAGRIVKESYGAAKQQHTFTIEVLWSKGTKPLPPLHPLLIKGRNLYRLATMRQKWEDEGERQKMISEKHARGALARSNRELRIKEKERRKMSKANRVPKMENQTRKENQNHGERTRSIPSQHLSQSQHFTSITPSSSFQNQNNEERIRSVLSQYLLQRQQGYEPNINRPLVMSQTRRPLESLNCLTRSQDSCSFQRRSAGMNPLSQKHGCDRTRLCRFYAQGRCYYGYRCKYIHENVSTS